MRRGLPVRARATVMCAVVALLALVFVVPSAVADTQDEIEAQKAKIDDILDRIEDQNATIASLQADAEALADEITLVEQDIANTTDRIQSLRAEIRAATGLLEDLQAQLDARAAQVYMQGGGNALELLLGSDTYGDFASRLEFVNQAVKSDRELFSEVQNGRGELEDKRNAVQDAKRRLEADQASLTDRQEELSETLLQAQGVLSQLEADHSEAESLLRDLEDKRAAEIEAARLAELKRQQELAEQRAEAARQAAEEEAQQQDQGGGSGGGSGGGGGPGPLLVCPVDPPRTYSDSFGDPRPGGRIHQGVDIFAPYGTAIRAPFPGMAVAGSNDLGGLTVHVLGAGGFVYNAHLSAYGATGAVGTGDVVGYVGTSGNAQGKSPHDHFEWHPGGGAAVDPFPYLNEVC